MRRRLRSGFTTGACASASSKAATLILMNSLKTIYSTTEYQYLSSTKEINPVDILLPIGERAVFSIHRSDFKEDENSFYATASVIKFAGDDPDVTNKAEIQTTVKLKKADLIINFAQSYIKDESSIPSIELRGGKGVGIVTKPGLPVPVGSPAINPVPQKMIKDAIIEAILNNNTNFRLKNLEVTISVTDGEKLALKTLNPRLGIIGGISILGTTGIVKPLSAEAWTATIETSMNMAAASGHKEIVLSSGRTSEKAHMRLFNFPQECYVMMGDFIEFSLREAKKHNFQKIHLCTQWAKMLKISQSIPQTHVKFGAIDLDRAVQFLKANGVLLSNKKFNSAREIFEFINQHRKDPNEVFAIVCIKAKDYCQTITKDIPVICNLVSYDGAIVFSV
ncbi:MAG: cobalt-precorrin-5B (C(1))-methyltransferase CbiD [Thermodesulfovibrionales bacterium]|nr:cobalt-precorrin-5B (C(1))-methyltransferase CbiD [Thermodesulfovibrionales bacterium]